MSTQIQPDMTLASASIIPDINLLLPLSHLLGIGVNELLGGDRRAELERAWQRALPFGDELALLAADDALKEFPDDEEMG